MRLEKIPNGSTLRPAGSRTNESMNRIVKACLLGKWTLALDLPHLKVLTAHTGLVIYVHEDLIER